MAKTVETFDFAARPSINDALVRELMTGEYVDRGENVLLVGNSGTGKTHLARALAFKLARQLLDHLDQQAAVKDASRLGEDCPTRHEERPRRLGPFSVRWPLLNARNQERPCQSLETR